MTHWGRAGERLGPAEVEERRRRRAARANQDRAAHAVMLAEARRGWERGLVRPWYITNALDAKGLDGPDVDHACGVEEPTVDLWEAGEIYPTFKQLCALADLTGMLPSWFVTEHRPMDDGRVFICGRGRTPYMPEPRSLVTTFRRDAIAASVRADQEHRNERSN